MTYKVESSLNDFPMWGAAVQTRDIIQAYDDEHGTNLWSSVMAFADDLFNECEDYTNTDVNDWLAFDVPNMKDEPWSEAFEG